jgi:hypothetical protein
MLLWWWWWWLFLLRQLFSLAIVCLSSCSDHASSRVFLNSTAELHVAIDSSDAPIEVNIQRDDSGSAAAAAAVAAATAAASAVPKVTSDEAAPVLPLPWKFITSPGASILSLLPCVCLILAPLLLKIDVWFLNVSIMLCLIGQTWLDPKICPMVIDCIAVACLPCTNTITKCHPCFIGRFPAQHFAPTSTWCAGAAMLGLCL